MSAWRADNRISKDCPSASLLWTASRVLADVHWDWDTEQGCYRTNEWTRDCFYKDVRHFPAPTPLASLLRAVREDERLADPTIRLIALHIACEYVDSLIAERRL